MYFGVFLCEFMVTYLIYQLGRPKADYYGGVWGGGAPPGNKTCVQPFCFGFALFSCLNALCFGTRLCVVCFTFLILNVL